MRKIAWIGFFERPSLWLPLLVALVFLLSVGLPPSLDEEAYLVMAREISPHMGRPYDWSRTWQPFHTGPSSYHFAHPPLHWMLLAAWMRALGGGSLALLKVVHALPFVLLLGWAVGRLGERYCARPSLPSLLWLASPLTLLGLQAGLMVDLVAISLATGSLALWTGRGREGGPRALLAGVLFGLACATKYPMLLLVPVLLTEMLLSPREPRARRAMLLFWSAFLLVMGGVELWLWAIYGDFHPLIVLAGARSIARGAPSGRLLGVLVRLGIVFFPLSIAVLRKGRISVLIALLPSLGLLMMLHPQDLSIPQLGGLFICLLAGLGLLVFVLWSGARDQATITLVVWFLAFASGVVLLHNFASGRYLWPLVAPASLLMARAMESEREPWAGASMARVALISTTLLSGSLMAWGNSRYIRDLDELGARVVAMAETGRFTGEWTFRWRLEQAGWRFFAAKGPDGGGSAPGVEPLRSGDLLAVPRNASPGPVPAQGLTLIDEYASKGTFPLRVCDVDAHAGYYGETGGELPFWFSRAPLEQVRVYKVR